ncbi:MAG: DUF1428 domain-containing protein [Hyphomicrobiaceae bacterium]|nr:DUF1428 domain-containing protein [Hyphomicrobiaceae bacterium]
MAYIDGCVMPVPVANKEAFIAHAHVFRAVALKHGAEATMECWADDVKEGVVTSLPKAVDLQDGEAVVFSWIVWPSKEARDEGWAKVMDDAAFADGNNPMPFDGKRMIFGGFNALDLG